MKVLYVEDNPANVFLVKRVAKMGQHEIVNYIDGDQAIQKFNEINPDLVLMDIQLAGGMSGLDVVKKLREKGIQTPIIAVTAYAMVGDKERCIEAGCTDYLAKPLPIPRLVEIFKHYSDEVAAKSAKEVASTTVPSVTTPDTQTDHIKADVKATNDNVSAISKVEDSTQQDDTDSEVKASTDETVKTDTKQGDVTTTTSSEVVADAETEEATAKKTDSDVSQNEDEDDTIAEKPVAPINVNDTVENKEEVSTGETI